MRLKYLIWLCPPVWAVFGVQKLYTAAANPAPVTTTCEAVLANPPPAHWLRLEGCFADWDNSAYEHLSGHEKALTLYVPLHSEGGDGRETRLVLRTRDERMLATVNAGGLPSRRTTYEGLVLFGADLLEGDRGEVAKLFPYLGDDFILLAHDERPQWGLGLAFLVMATILCGVLAWLFVRGRRREQLSRVAEPGNPETSRRRFGRTRIARR